MADDSEDYIAAGAAEAHASTHEAGGSDELDITGLTPADHASRHELGGADEIDVTGLTGVGHNLVDRGDASGADLNQEAMTLDSNWIDWDVSLIVPAGAVAIELRVFQTNTSIGKQLTFRKKGNSNNYNVTEHKQIAQNVTEFWHGMCFCNTARVVQYMATAPVEAWTNINITIRGWWI